MYGKAALSHWRCFFKQMKYGKVALSHWCGFFKQVKYKKPCSSTDAAFSNKWSMEKPRYSTDVALLNKWSMEKPRCSTDAAFQTSEVWKSRIIATTRHFQTTLCVHIRGAAFCGNWFALMFSSNKGCVALLSFHCNIECEPLVTTVCIALSLPCTVPLRRTTIGAGVAEESLKCRIIISSLVYEITDCELFEQPQQIAAHSKIAIQRTVGDLVLKEFLCKGRGKESFFIWSNPLFL